MDREINPVFRRNQLIKRGLFSILSVAVLAVILLTASAWIRPSISRSLIRTATVEVGPVQSTITASGTVLPEFEQVMSSPIETRVVKILKRNGDLLKKGEPILQLDVSASELALSSINQQIELKLNQQAKTKLDLKSTIGSLKSQWEIKNLDYQSFKSTAARNDVLFQDGLVSKEVLHEAELAEQKASFELKQLEVSERDAEASTKTLLEGMELEMSTLQQQRAQSQRQLELATTKADRDGVLTWVVNDVGAAVHTGDVLARVADLHTFKIEATLSDVHANRLTAGLPVNIKVNDSMLTGSITSVNPTIKDGVITLVVGLADKSNSLLHSNLRVDVLIVTDQKSSVLRIKKGPFVGGDGPHDVFVIRGGSAVKTPVVIGISSFDYYEVPKGLIEGDEVIISDMADYMYLKEVKLK